MRNWNGAKTWNHRAELRIFLCRCSCSLFPVPCSLGSLSHYSCFLFPVPCSLGSLSRYSCSLFPVPCSPGFLPHYSCSLFPVPCSVRSLPSSNSRFIGAGPSQYRSDADPLAHQKRLCVHALAAGGLELKHLERALAAAHEKALLW